ncbi:hypothetical protein CICLE_v100310092mg, partial [Citrus x clementina]
MASETLEEAKQKEEAAPAPAEEVEKKAEAQEGAKDGEAVKEENNEEEEEEKKEDEKETKEEVHTEEVSAKDDDVTKEGDVAAKAEEETKDKEEKQEKPEGAKKGKRSRKAGVKKPSEESDEPKKEKEKEKDKDKEKVKEPVTPTSERPTRERKVVERYSAPSTGRSAAKPVSIEKGRGTQLKDIPNVAFKLSRRKPDDNLHMLHTILFGKKAKAQTLKKNIGQFSGFVWSDNEEKHRAKVKEKIDKCVKEKLLDFCDVLNIPINKAVVKKEELSVKLLEFLECPHATTDILLADKEQKGKKRKVTPSKNASHGEASDAK